jgi:hypothetical protein
MPLSEHEQRILNEIEKRLLEEDPKFAQQVSSSFRAHLVSRVRWAAAGFILGLAIVIVGVIVMQVPLLGLVGFAVMIGSILLFAQSLRHRATAERASEDPSQGAGPKRGAPRRRGGGSDGWWNRVNERWRQRWEERGGRPPEQR